MFEKGSGIDNILAIDEDNALYYVDFKTTQPLKGNLWDTGYLDNYKKGTFQFTKLADNVKNVYEMTDGDLGSNGGNYYYETLDGELQKCNVEEIASSKMKKKISKIGKMPNYDDIWVKEVSFEYEDDGAGKISGIIRQGNTIKAMADVSADSKTVITDDVMLGNNDEDSKKVFENIDFSKVVVDSTYFLVLGKDGYIYKICA